MAGLTERGIDQIDMVPLSDNHVPGAARSITSAGRGPFGFAFSDSLRLYIAESTAGTTSACNIDTEGTPLVLSAALPTQQRATCWLAISTDNGWIYVTNTASRSISSYRVAEDGTLTLIASVAATTSGPPVDVIADAGGHLSVLTTDGSIQTFLIDKTSGSLTSFQTVSGLPPGTNGLAGN